MSESIQAQVSVAPADAPLLDAALAHAQALAGNHRFSATPQGPGQAALLLEADSNEQLVAGLEAVGPAFVALAGRARVHGLAFSAGVSPSLLARIGQAAS